MLNLAKKEDATPRDILIHLAASYYAVNILRWLVDELEASSISEIIRRAIQALEYVELDMEALQMPDDLNVLSFPTREGSERGSNTGLEELVKIHVRVPPAVKTKIDELKEEYGGTYSSVVTQALIALAQLVRIRNNLRNASEGPVCHLPQEAIEAILA